ncbi:hypothetical protein TNCV_4825831 [Trichonephila clavipes]|uniref:Uncharacterized protein n=1 Tax=Trichonephila clavipes TaxID=2585209 RepID=A0A8X6V5T8_TRICX|nr:hypothetical protein TNCV_4825831 [Trichonephila clavipes]
MRKLLAVRLEGPDDSTKNMGTPELVDMVFKQIEEERRGKQQSKMSRKKRKFVDLENRVEHPKEFTTYYPILDRYSKLAMSDRQLYENLLPLTLDYQDLVQNNYPSDEPGLFYWPKMVNAEETDRICIRCKHSFQIGLGDVYSAALNNRCYYHPRKAQGKQKKIFLLRARPGC